MGVQRRHRERTHPAGQRVVEIGSDRDQRLQGVLLIVTHREQQRREPARRPRVYIGASVDQGLDRSGVPFDRRPHQRGLVAPLFSGVDLSAMSEEDHDGIRSTGPGHSHEWRFSFR